jgi:hypothetical protein
MKRELFEALVRRLLSRKPFRPFSIKLVDGEAIRVDHPEAMIVRAGVGAVMDSRGYLYDFDEESVAAVVRGGNGAARR